MKVWSNLWKGMQDISFDKEPFMWQFYKILLKGCSLKGKKVLEIGCGTGINSALMARKGAKVTLLDSSKEAIKIAKKTFDKFSLDGEFVHADVFDCNFNKDYDICTSEGVIEHFKGNARQGIIDIHARVVKKHGKVVIIVPNLKCPPYRLGKFLAEQTGTWIYDNEYPYTKMELLERMRNAGLKTGKVIGGELLFSFGWLFAPLWMSAGDLVKKSLRFGTNGNSNIVKLNYNNFLANRFGRVLGTVGQKK